MYILLNLLSEPNGIKLHSLEEIKKFLLIVMVNAGNPSIWEAEAGGIRNVSPAWAS
jgi:hypothetical protein